MHLVLFSISLSKTLSAGPDVVKARALDRMDPDELARLGGGEIWPLAAAYDLGEVCDNGNYLESEKVAVNHGVCGDTPQVNKSNRLA